MGELKGAEPFFGLLGSKAVTAKSHFSFKDSKNGLFISRHSLSIR